jgi:hypothetical protein
LVAGGAGGTPGGFNFENAEYSNAKIYKVCQNYFMYKFIFEYRSLENKALKASMEKVMLKTLVIQD